MEIYVREASGEVTAATISHGNPVAPRSVSAMTRLHNDSGFLIVTGPSGRASFTVDGGEVVRLEPQMQAWIGNHGHAPFPGTVRRFMGRSWLTIEAVGSHHHYSDHLGQKR